MLKENFKNRANRLQKLIGLDAPPIILENEVRMLNEAYNRYVGSIKEPTNPKFEVDSDEEHYEYVDYCLANGHIGIKEWRKIN